MKERYRVLLPIDVDGVVYQYDQEVELDEETAKAYFHALVRVPASAEEEK